MMVWLSALALSAPPSPEAMLRAGQFRLVAAASTQILARQPDDLQARAWLTQAHAGLERCRGALEGVALLRGSVAWSAGLAIAEGRCATIEGDWSRAEAAYEEAVRLEPELVRGWIGLAEVAAARADGRLLESALIALEGQTRAPHAAQMVRADLAQQYGLGVDAEVFELRRALRSSRARVTAETSLALTDAREWLRAGDPSRAYSVLEGSARGHYGAAEVGAWLGEAARRMGWEDRARAIFATGLVARSPRVDARLLRARWLIDAGELAAAEAVLEETRGLHMPLWLGTRWYLARARGEDLSPWEEAYADAPVGLGPLTHLLPRDGALSDSR